MGIAERVRNEATAEGGPGLAEMQLLDLAGRMFGLELLVGPYAVAHYRLHHTLCNPAGVGTAAPQARFGFLSAGISEERRAADQLKARQPILAIIGNPPYWRLKEGEDRTLVGAWLNDLWDDLKRPVRDAGNGNQLNTFPELSVAFWRWAMWKLFEAEGAPQRGVVCFITNRTFLTGLPYAGLRRMMLARFDRIEIIDLRGDLRQGPRAGAEGDTGVFNLQVGTAIMVAVADGSRTGRPAEVRYLDCWAEGLFGRAAKLHWLTEGSDAGCLPNAITVAREDLEDFRPRPFNNSEWPSLRGCFEFQKSGMKSNNDPGFVDATPEGVVQKVDAFLSRSGHQTPNPGLLRQLSYRPFDHQWFYNDSGLF